MHGRLSTVLLSSLAMITGLSVSAAAAPPNSGLHCGDTVTTDVVLTKNLTCAGTALQVGIPDGAAVHIDLNGYRLRGNGTGVGIDLTGSPGIGDLVVSDGTISGFASALLGLPGAAPQVANVTVSRMTIKGNGLWLAPMALQSNLVEYSTIIDSGLGRAYTDASLTVQDTKLVRSDILSFGETDNYLYDNVFVGAGFETGPAADVIAIGNSFTGCEIGIHLPDQWHAGDTKVEDNRFLKCRVGVALDKIYGAVSVRRNSFIRNTEAGMTFDAMSLLPGLPKARDIADNYFLRNQGDGLVGTGAGTVSVTGNDTLRNAGHGINVSTVIDGGLNVAHKNFTDPQCIGVICTNSHSAQP